MATKSEKYSELHQTALRHFNKTQTALRDERLQCVQDRRFVSIAGAQWEGPLGVQFENKPRLECNKIAMAINRIISEYRNNRVSVSFTSKEGSEYDDLADTCAALFRSDEQDSSANEAYDNAFEEAVTGGYGAFRLRAEYENDEDDEDERQRIRIEPIFDADSTVFFDLDAKRQDKADAKYCFVLYSMTYDGYRDEFNADPTTMPKQIQQRLFDWLTPDVVYVAEYYIVEDVRETIHIYGGLGDSEERRVSDAEFEQYPDLESELTAMGYRKLRQKKLKTKKVHKYLINGAQVLEDCGYIAGKNIPIIPVYGKRWFIDNVERCSGHVRLAKDAQRLKNMQLSKLAEISAISSVEKPIFTPEQINGHQQAWADDNLKNYPYLLINQLTDMHGNPTAVGPAAYTRSPQLPPAMTALLQLTEVDMADVLGNQQQADKMVSNISGKAVEMIQTRLDTQTFIYMSNFSKAVQRAGIIWLSMAKEIYVESGRKMKGINEGGSIQSIELQKPVLNEDNDIEHENDLSEADFDVAVDVGPSSSSKRAATVRALTGMMQMVSDPEMVSVLANAAIANIEGEGLSDIRAWGRKKMLRIGAAKPTDEEALEMQNEAQNAQPDPQAMYLQAAAKESEAKAQQAQANTILTVAKSKETEAKTAEIIAGMSIAERDTIIRIAEALRNAHQYETQVNTTSNANTAPTQPNQMGENT